MFGETVIVSKSVEDGGVQAREPISREDERQTIDMARVFRLPVSKEIRYVWSLLSVPQWDVGEAGSHQKDVKNVSDVRENKQQSGFSYHVHVTCSVNEKRVAIWIEMEWKVQPQPAAPDHLDVWRAGSSAF